MDSSPRSRTPGHGPALLDQLRRDGIRQVEKDLRDGKYDGQAAQAVRTWLRIKTMEAAGQLVASRYPVAQLIDHQPAARGRSRFATRLKLAALGFIIVMLSGLAWLLTVIS